VAGKTLVTGAAGFIGSHLVELLVKKGETVVCTVFNKDPVNHLSPEVRNSKKVEIIVGDIRDPAFVWKAMKGCSKVYHLAATLNEPSIPDSEFHTTNVDGTRNIFEAALKLGVKKVVHTSSVAAIKDSPKRIDETYHHNDNFEGPYELTKYKTEELASEYGSKGLKITIVNPTIVYGPRETHTLGAIFRRYIQPRVRFVSFKNSILNLIYVEDAAEGFYRAMQKGRPGQRYILGGPEMTLGQFVATLDEVTGNHKPIITIPGFLLELIVSIAEPILGIVGLHPPIMKAQIKAMKRGTAVDISKAKKELGLPERPIREGVKKSLDWYRLTGYIKW
jgi:dihydroflavonol-4-reductase